MREQEPTGGEDARAREQALTLISRAHGIRAEVEQARSHAGSTGRAQLSAVMASLSSAEVRLAQAANAPSGEPIDLSGIEAALGSTEQDAEAGVQEVSAETNVANARSAAAIYAATRTEVQDLSHDLFEQKIFDPYLRFGSTEDEQEYRQREADRSHQIERLLAQHTAKGDYSAGLIERGQMVDAGAHGATASPDYKAKLDQLDTTLEQQKQALGEPAASPTPVVTVKPDPSVDLAALGITSDNAATSEAGHGLADQTRPQGGKSTSRG